MCGNIMCNFIVNITLLRCSGRSHFALAITAFPNIIYCLLFLYVAQLSSNPPGRKPLSIIIKFTIIQIRYIA